MFRRWKHYEDPLLYFVIRFCYQVKVGLFLQIDMQGFVSRKYD